MWMSTEEARSDFILAAAALVFGTMVADFVFALPFYPGGMLGSWLLPVWVVLLMVLPPRFLARERGQELAAFGLGADRSGLTDGILLVVPLAATGYVHSFSSGNVVGALLGRLGAPVVSSPGVASPDIVTIAIRLAILAAGAMGSVLLFGMLVVRARDAFRPTEIPLLEGLRTYGIGAVAVGTVLGLLVSLSGGPAVWEILLTSGAMIVVILVTDRLVASTDRTTRATMLAPAIVVVVAYVFTRGGGLFSSSLAANLHRGAMAAAVAIVVATLIETRRSAWAVVPLVAVTLWAPTCATLPVAPLLSGLGGC